MPIEEVKDMTWAEFQLRSFQYWEDRKHEMRLFREVAYIGYCNLFGFSKEKPKPKEVFWPIDEKTKNYDSIAKSLKEAMDRYRKEKNGN